MSFFQPLAQQPADALLALIGMFRNDPRPGKIDLGVGVFRDDAGHTPVMRAVKAAERKLWESQDSKSYLGPEGNVAFARHMARLALGDVDLGGRLTGVQTPGGTGALRLGAELIAASRPGVTVWVGTPTWPNHPPILAAAGLKAQSYKHFDPASQTLTFDSVMDALNRAQAGDVALLHGCCHNPTGADFSLEQWRVIADTLSSRGILPFLDLAYQGLGLGMEQDAAGVRMVMDACPEAVLAYSCDKNFGVYRDRVGALFVQTGSAADTDRVSSNMLALARANWSMPPDHGGAVIATLMDDAALVADWTLELNTMRDRLLGIRAALAAHGGVLGRVDQQRGMFSLLPLSPDVVKRLREDHAVYMAGSGRINVAGLSVETAGRFAAALNACL
ncbi:aromatic amino acid aminotransferase [Niveispirillum lacus]|uniref:Aromatic amino acid aminotransferase n=1 Tax=Niveispirillum lacus TaxID=1981099 RepID=A0A255Z1E8_9PROT|nr:amino acid aminotransferase [Niveispirillum lacus]OYQ34480.1 aromatic amino acid aminotransferase [Niveispirillum lacus]